MEKQKQYSLNEVDDFINRFKKKRGLKNKEKSYNADSDIKLEKIDKNKSEIISNNIKSNKSIQELTKTNEKLNQSNNNVISNKPNNTGNIKYKPINKNQNKKNWNKKI